MGRRKRQQEKADKEEKLNTMAETAAAFGAYRPHQQAAYDEGLNQTMQLLQPVNNMMEAMYGGGGAQVTAAGPEGGLMSPEAMAVGQTSQSPGFARPTPEGTILLPDGSFSPVVNDRGEAINEGAPATDYYGNPIASGPTGETKRTFY